MTNMTTRPTRGPLDTWPEQMRSHTLRQLRDATTLVPREIDSPLSRNCYRTTQLGTIAKAGGYLVDSRRVGDHRERAQVFLLLQCGLDFTVVVPVSSKHPLSWYPWRNRFGRTRDRNRLHQHITWSSSGIFLKEEHLPVSPRLDSHSDGRGNHHPGWVNNFDLIEAGDIFHLFTNKAAQMDGNTRKYFFGQNPEIWTS